MPLTTVQSEWINEVAGIDVGNWEERNAKRQFELQDVRSKLEPIKIEIRAILDISMKKKGGGSIPFLVGDREAQWAADEEIDTTHDTRDLAEALSVEDMNRAMRAKDTLNLLGRQLEVATYNGLPLFNEKEIREEFWKPLVREGIYPDNLVDDLYNETVQVFRGANEYYEQRQERDAAAHETSKLKDFQFIKGKAIIVAGAINDACGGPAVIGTVLEATDTFVDAMITIYEGVIEKDAESILDAIGDIIGQSLSTAGVDSTIAGLVGSSFSTASKGGLACEAFAKGDPKAAFAHIAGCIESAFETADAGNKDGPFTEIGHYIGLAIESSIDVHGAIKCLKSNPVDMAGLLAIAESATQRAFKEGMAKYVDALDKEDDEADELNDNIEEISDEDLKGIFEVGGKLHNRLKPEAMEEAKAEMLAAHNKAFQEELAKELDPDNKEFENELDDILATANIDPDERKRLGLEKKHQNSIEKMIQKIEKARAAMKIAEGIFDTGMKTAAEFFEPLQMGVAGKDFVKNMLIALKRAVELNQWIDQVEKAMNAASVYASAFANRIKNLRIQITERTAHALFALLKVIGGALSTAGAAGFGAGALAGVIVSKAATAAEAGFDAIMYIRARKDAHDQWKLYTGCLALGDLTDRKMMRQVLKGNPTLSKYAMAYGALIEDDPIAKMGMRVCGIKEQHLQEDGAEVDLVVKYLEIKFNDDPKLIRAQIDSTWKPEGAGEIKFTVWRSNLKSAAKETGFVAEGLGAIDGAFGNFEVARQAYEIRVPSYTKLRSSFVSAKRATEGEGDSLGLAIEELHDVTKQFSENLDRFGPLNSRAEKSPELQGDIDFRDEYAGIMESLLAGDDKRRELVEAVDTRSNSYAEYLTTYIDSDIASYLHGLKGFVEERDAFVTASRRLRESLNKYEPQRLDKETQEKDVDQLVKAHMKDLCMLLETIQRDAEKLDAGASKEYVDLKALKEQRMAKLQEVREQASAARSSLTATVLPLDRADMRKRTAHWQLTESEKKTQSDAILTEDYYQLGGDNALFDAKLEAWGKSDEKKSYDAVVEKLNEAKERLQDLEQQLQSVKGTDAATPILQQMEPLIPEVGYLEGDLVEEQKNLPDRDKLSAMDIRWKVNELSRLTKKG